MLDNEIVRGPLPQDLTDIVQPLLAEAAVDAVQNGDFLIQNGIRDLSHAVRYDILSLKKVELVVVHTNVADIICNHHRECSPHYQIA